MLSDSAYNAMLTSVFTIAVKIWVCLLFSPNQSNSKHQWWETVHITIPHFVLTRVYLYTVQNICTFEEFSLEGIFYRLSITRKVEDQDTYDQGH